MRHKAVISRAAVLWLALLGSGLPASAQTKPGAVAAGARGAAPVPLPALAPADEIQRLSPPEALPGVVPASDPNAQAAPTIAVSALPAEPAAQAPAPSPVPPSAAYARKPLREVQAEERSSRELQRRIDRLLLELVAIDSDGGLQVDRKRGFLAQLDEVLGAVPTELPAPVRAFSTLKASREAYQEARLRIYKDLRLANRNRRLPDLQRLNQEAIWANLVMTKIQLKSAQMMLLGKSRLPRPAMLRKAALWALEGAWHSAKSLGAELHYRVERLRAVEIRRQYETVDGEGNRVVVFGLPGYDIRILRSAAGEQPRIQIREQRWRSIHATLDSAGVDARNGRPAEALRKLDLLAGLYSAPERGGAAPVLLRDYGTVAAELAEIRRLVREDPAGEMKRRISALKSNVSDPDAIAWQDIQYKDMETALRGEADKLESNLEESMRIIRNRADLMHYAAILDVAVRRSERSQRHPLSGANRKSLLRGLDALARWADDGVVPEKKRVSANLKEAIEAIRRSDYAGARSLMAGEPEGRRPAHDSAVEALDDRLDSLDRISGHIRRRAAALLRRRRST